MKVDKNKIKNKLKDNAKFFIITVKADNNVVTINFKCDTDEFSCKVLKEVNEFGIVKYKISV